MQWSERRTWEIPRNDTERKKHINIGGGPAGTTNSGDDQSINNLPRFSTIRDHGLSDGIDPSFKRLTLPKTSFLPSYTQKRQKDSLLRQHKQSIQKWADNGRLQQDTTIDNQ